MPLVADRFKLWLDSERSCQHWSVRFATLEVLHRTSVGLSTAPARAPNLRACDLTSNVTIHAGVAGTKLATRGFWPEAVTPIHLSNKLQRVSNPRCIKSVIEVQSFCAPRILNPFVEIESRLADVLGRFAFGNC